MIFRTAIVQRITASTGYGSAGLLAGLTLAEVELVLRIAVGALSVVSLIIHIVITIRKETRKQKK